MPCLSEETLLTFARADLDPEAHSAAEAHLDACGTCQEMVAALGAALLDEGVVPRAGDDVRESSTPSEHLRTELPSLLPDTFVGRYRLCEAIGAGGGGAVYRAHDPELDRAVALKLVRPFSSFAADPVGGRERLLREARAMARLAHPNVVNVFDVGIFEGLVFIVMELVDGLPLSRWLRSAPRSADEILARFLEAGRGLEAAHEAGIVHGDFKPDNVLVGRDGRARVTDFGLAKPLAWPAGAPRATNVSRPLLPVPGGMTIAGGTPGYMAPEQLAGAQPTDRADQHSFCRALLDELERARAVSAAARHRKTLLRGLAADPAARYPSMGELLTALSSPTQLRSRARVWFTIGIAAAALGATGLLVARRSGGRGAEMGCVAELSAGGRHACVLRRDGTVRCWGAADKGQLGAGPPTQRPSPQAVAVLTAAGAPLEDVVSLASGRHGGCVIQSNGSVMCWGLPRIAAQPESQAPARRRRTGAVRVFGGGVSVTVGALHACVTRPGGATFCWGSNGDGQLGIDEAVEGMHSPARLVWEAGSPAIAMVTAGVGHTCALMGDTTVRCWGTNQAGQLGQPPSRLSRSTAPMTVLAADGQPLRDAIRLAAGRSHSCVVRADDSVWCWGAGNAGQLGDGSMVDRGEAVQVVNETGAPLDQAVQVGAGWTHSCAVRRDGTVWCWGRNSAGQLGTGSDLPSATHAAIVRRADGAPLKDVRRVTLGDLFSCALTDTGQVWCWGSARHGQLGTLAIQESRAATPISGLCGSEDAHVGGSKASIP